MNLFNKKIIPEVVEVVENDVDSDGDYIVRYNRNYYIDYKDGQLVIVRIMSKVHNSLVRRTLGTMKYHSKIGDWIVRLLNVS